MRNPVLSAAAALGCALALLSLNTQAQGELALESAESRYSYIVGYQLGRRVVEQMQSQNVDLDIEALVAGLRDTIGETAPRVTQEQALAAIEVLRGRLEKKSGAAAEENAKAGKTFLEENAKKDGVVTTASGLQYRVLMTGTGKSPTGQSEVIVHYRGALIDGTEFDSSHKRGEPATFTAGQVIPGFREALLLMKEGDKWEVFIPSELGYGERGTGANIGPNATLIFELELITVASNPKPDAKTN